MFSYYPYIKTEMFSCAKNYLKFLSKLSFNNGFLVLKKIFETHWSQFLSKTSLKEQWT